MARKTYIMGYVAGIIYSDGREWLLTKQGHWSNNSVIINNHVWATLEQALTVAQAKHSKQYPAFARAYMYETPNPKNAQGMRLATPEDHKRIMI